jgi:DNA repair exonuclease SbcCD nuclease subunit
MYNSYTPPDNSVVNIGLLHTQLDPANKNYVPCSLNDLLSKKDIHYWALGHIHQMRILSSENPVVVYPGIPQGRDFGEEEIGGCLLVEFDYNEKPRIFFIPTSSLIWRKIDVFIDSDMQNRPENLEDLKNLLINRGEQVLSEEMIYPEFNIPSSFKYDFFAGYIVRWIIAGRGEIHEELAEDEEAADYLISEVNKQFYSRQPFIYTDSIAIRTTKNIPSLAQLSQQSTVAREIEGIINNPGFKDMVEKEFGNIWETKYDHENINEERFQLDDETYKRIINKAVDLIIEQMIAKEEGR